MNARTTKQGSALLIVLGMLSFMVVSAVGFAIFMRQSRAPSSYLRRASSSRYLLKAALANAVARLDGALDPMTGYCEGVYDDPYPGVVVVENPPLPDPENGDLWTKRVFTPFGLIDSDETVSTMTLEALAYLPPAIINEVRVYSRQTRTAQWRNLSYDMGRYAFTAVDVSDLFDINKLDADKRRTSAPGERINLSSLFEDAEALKSVQTGAGDIPFVSLADFNLVAGSSSSYAPFIKYLSGASDVSIYREDETVKNELFITDTWFPKTNTTASTTTIDLTSKQPFPTFGASNFFDIDNANNDLYDLLRVNLGGAGLACLYDYLDSNRTPISLALPTVETQPMIASVSVDFGTEIRLSESTSGDDAKETSVDVTEEGTTYKITRKVTPHKLVVPQSSFVVSGTAIFPFKRVDSASGRKGTWKVEALAALFFAEDEIKARFKAESVIRPKADYWTNPPTTKDAGGVVWIRGTGQSLSFDDNVDTVVKAIKDYQVEVSLQKQEFPVYYEVTEKKQRYTDTGGTETVDEWTLTTTDSTREPETGALTVFSKDGETHSVYKSYYENNYKEKIWIDEGDLRDASKRGKNSQNFIEMTDETTFRPYIAVWVRVTDGSETVDLAPASYRDDEEYLNGCSYDAGFVGDLVKFSGDGSPILDFKYTPSFSFKMLTGEESATFYQSATLEPEGWRALYAADPRYNFAPEDWFGTTDEDGASPDHWKNYVGVGTTSGLLGTGGRDSDIFMFTSDQEYLQSMGELAFLPYVQDLTGEADFIEGDFMSESRYHGRNDFSARSATSTSGFANGSRFWKTYTAFDRGDGIDPIYSLTKGGVTYTVTTGDGDFRVNPFSRDPRVIEAAIKDTPYDWFVASTNATRNPTATKEPSARAEWAFCQDSSKAKITDSEMEEIADKMISAFGEKAREGKSWETAFEDFAWTVSGVTDEEKRSLFGVELEKPLHDVDRKYLYSFWRECFQNRQQLFLVFLRAEPLTVGGSGASALAASQLGARGVALVWRDPAAPSRGGVSSRPRRESLTSTDQWASFYETFAPHRTRVLFYHQFD